MSNPTVIKKSSDDGDETSSWSSDPGTTSTPAVEEIEDENERLFLSTSLGTKFSLDVLLTATVSLDVLSVNKSRDTDIGSGSSGRVYKGKLQESDRSVAVKILNKDSESKKQFLVEALMIPRLKHSNVIDLIGYCTDDGHRMLVYELMPFRCLEYRLYGIKEMKRPNWIERMGIALGVAKALDYLHNKVLHPPILFRDLKPSNILLDESFHPKISDFGLAIYGPDYDEDDSHLFTDTTAMGTLAYSAPEYGNGSKFTPECDVYSFGVVLLELCTGLRPLDRGREKYKLVDWVEYKLENEAGAKDLADSRLTGQFREDIFLSVINVGLMCTKEDPSSRPSMTDVAENMAKFIAQQQSHDKERRANADRVSAAAESNPKPQAQEKMGMSEYLGEGSQAQDSPDLNTNPDDAVEKQGSTI